MIRPYWWLLLDHMGIALMRFFLSSLWQSSLLFATVLVILFALRNHKASIRHKLWILALVLTPILPFMTSLAGRIGSPQLSLPVLPTYRDSSPVPSLNIDVPREIPPENVDIPQHGFSSRRDSNASPNAGSVSHPFSIKEYPWAVAMMVYAGGAGFFLLWFLIGRLRIRRWRLESLPLTEERALDVFHQAAQKLNLTRDVLVLESRLVPAPVSMGLFRPGILLPKGLASSLSLKELESVALHEMVHIKHHDPIFLGLAAFMRALFFFHPLVWLAARRISHLAEISADDKVVEAIGEPLGYARLLTRLAENLLKRPLGTEMATGLLFNKGAFLKRVEIILGRRSRLARLSLLALIGVIFAIVVSLLLSLSLPLRVASLEQESRAEESTAPIQKSPLASPESEIWNKPLSHYQIGGVQREAIPAIDLSALDQDIWINPADFGFTLKDAPEQIFEKAGKGDLCVPEENVLLTLRGTRMAPLKIPAPIRPMEPFELRLKRMTMEQVVDQIQAHISANPQSENDRFKVVPDTHYALTRPDGLLVYLEIFGPPEMLSVRFIPRKPDLNIQEEEQRETPGSHPKGAGRKDESQTIPGLRLQFRLVSDKEIPGETDSFSFTPKRGEEQTIHLFKQILFGESDIQSSEIKATFLYEDPYYLELVFTPEAASRFARVTRENIGKGLAIVLNNIVLAAPIIKYEIPNGRVGIHGNFSLSELVTFREIITGIPYKNRNEKLQEPEWGKEIQGVKVELVKKGPIILYTPHGEITLHIENRGDAPINVYYVLPYRDLPEWELKGRGLEVINSQGESVAARLLILEGQARAIPAKENWEFTSILDHFYFDFPEPGRYKARALIRVEKGETSFLVGSKWLEFDAQLTGRPPEPVSSGYWDLQEALATEIVLWKHQKASRQAVMDKYLALPLKFSNSKFALEGYFRAGRLASVSHPQLYQDTGDMALSRKYFQEIVKRWGDVVADSTIFARMHAFYQTPDFEKSRQDTLQWLKSLTEDQKIRSIREYFIFPNDEKPSEETIQNCLKSLNENIAAHIQSLERQTRQSEAKQGASESQTITGVDQSLQGMVSREDGRALEGVKIVNWFPFGSNPQETWTNSRGIYYFKTRLGYVVKAEKAGYAPAFEEFRDTYNSSQAQEEPLFANITMTRGGTVTGRIMDKSSGEPLSGAKVLVDRKAKDPHVGNLPYDIWTSEQITTDNDGGFHMELVPTGLVKVRAEADGYKSEESGYLELEIGKTKSFEISLVKMTSEEIRAEKIEKEKQEKRDRSLSGVVKDSSGKSLDGVKISNFFPNGSMPQETFTDSKGEFRFDRERGYVVVAKREGFAPSFHEFKDKYYEIRRTGKDPLQVEITLTPGGMIDGTIRSEEDEKPIPHAEVWLDCWAKDSDVGNNRYIIWTGEPVKADAEGRFLIDHAPEGALRLHARAEGWAENISPEFSVATGESKIVNLALYQGMNLKVQVLDKDNLKPIQGAEVRIYQLGFKQSDKDGICVFQYMAIGSYNLQCRSQGYHELTGEEIKIDRKKGEKNLRILLVPISNP